jgi:hypothetical protein
MAIKNPALPGFLLLAPAEIITAETQGTQRKSMLTTITAVLICPLPAPAGLL